MRTNGEADPGATTVTLIRYDADTFNEEELEDLHDLEAKLEEGGVCWLNVANAGSDHAVIRRVAEAVSLHPLALDDVLHEGQRPRAEEYGDHLFMLMRMLLVQDLAVPPSKESAQGTRSGRAAGAALDGRATVSEDDQDDDVTTPPGEPSTTQPASEASDNDGLHSAQVALVLSEGLVVTFLETEQDPFDELRERLREAHGPARGLGADFLAYRLIDVVISQYFTVVERYGDNLDALEDQILMHPSRAAFRQVNGLRRDLMLARRAIWPLRDAMARLLQPESELLSPETITYVRDAQSHVMQVIETLELLREMLTGLHDIYLTALNTRMNDIMKVLTIISTIFIPLTFLAGIYGMNFENQPEYGWRWAYPGLWGLMIVLVVGMLVLFRRKRWL